MYRLKSGFAAIVLVAAAFGAAALFSQVPSEVVRYSRPAEAELDAKIVWAVREAGRSGFDEGYWIGYSIHRYMNVSSHIGTYNSDRDAWELTIDEVLSGKNRPERTDADRTSVRRTAREVLDDLERTKRDEKKVWKDVAILFHYGSGKPSLPGRVRISNTDLAFDFKKRPLLWLGKAEDEESLSVVKGFYAKARTSELKKNLVAAAGLHGESELVLPFLENVLDGKDEDDIRKDAAFWIGQQKTKEALRILVRKAKSDDASAIRKSAVFSISQIELPEAADELIALARSSGHREVKKDAIFWLGQIASEKAGETLEELATMDEDIGIQERAIFALSQLPDNEGVEPLIKIAKTHPDPRIRKKAVFWLGECNDPRALQTLIDIIKK